MALYRCIGNGGGATPTDITPSNASPASMSADGVYKATAAGYAIESYNSKTPSNASPVALVSGEIDKMGGAGYAIESYSSITPSDSTPASISSGSIYKAGGAGYAIESSPSALAPSDSSPATITSGTIYKASGNGKAVENVNSITPSNSAPSMSNGSIYKAGAAGYAIGSYQSKTPSSSGVSFLAGFVKMAKAGVAYDEIPTISTYTNPKSKIDATSATFSLLNMQGSKLLVFLFYQAGSATAYNRLDGATADHGTLTKLCNLRQTNGQAYGTFYNLVIDADAVSCTLTSPYACFWQVFEAE